MADTLTISLARKSPNACAASRRNPQGLLEETAAAFDGAMGDNAELRRRIDAWKADRASVSADELHAELRGTKPE